MSDEEIIKRTTKEQIDYYLSYVDSHPEIKPNSVDLTRQKRLDELWQELTNDLNALKGPKRSAAKWKECLRHWKNQVRSRAKKAEARKKAARGGSYSPVELSPMEQRALDVFGTVMVEGIPGIVTIGAEAEVGMIAEGECSETSNDSAVPGWTPSSSRKRKVVSSEMMAELMQSMKERNDEEKRFCSASLKAFEDCSETMKEVAQSMNNVATAILLLSQAITRNGNN